jgi:hypothetical protein
MLPLFIVLIGVFWLASTLMVAMIRRIGMITVLGWLIFLPNLYSPMNRDYYHVHTFVRCSL